MRHHEHYRDCRITSYSSEYGLDYMTITHKLTGICLGSDPIVRDDINYYDLNLQKKLIREDTKQTLIIQMRKMAESMAI